MIHSLMLSALRRSWALQQSITLNVPHGDLTIPVVHGFGLGHLPSSDKALWFTPVLRQLMADRPGAMIDVGAHVGAFLLMWIRSVGRERPYYGFDPHVACVHYLERLIQANGLRQHHALPMGLSDAAGFLSLSANSDKDVFATVTPEHHARSFSFRRQVRVELGDEVLRELAVDRVGLIKVDVEGGELEVLRGFEQTLEKEHPLLHLEVAPYAELLASSDPAHRKAGEFRRNRVTQTEEFLVALGYRFERIEYCRGIVPVETLHDDGGSEDTDYLCTPKARA